MTTRVAPDRLPTATWARTRGVPAAVWLVVALQVTVCLLQTAVFPHGRSPDEAKQVDLVLQVADGTAWPWPDPGTLVTNVGVSAGQILPPDRLLGAAHLADRTFLPRSERPSWADAGGAAPWIFQGEPFNNQLVQHPPLYYLLGAAVVRAVPDRHELPFDQVWMILRWVNVLLAAPLPLLAWATARRLGLPDPLPLAASGAVVAIPELTHLLSSVNNDNLLVLLGAVATWLVARVLTGDRSARTALALGAVTSLALLTKGFALMMPAWVAVAYAVSWWHARGRGAAVAAAWAAAAMLPGLAWWARNVVLYGALQPHGTHADQDYLAASAEHHTWADGGARWLSRLTDRLITTFFVQDQASMRLHDGSWWAARVGLVALAVGIVVALVRGPLRRLDLLVLLLPAAALVAVVAKGSYEQFAAFGIWWAAQQGRYLYLAVVGLVVVALAGAACAPAHVRRWTPAAVLAFGLGMHAVFQVDTWKILWMPDRHGSPAAVRAAARALVEVHPFGWPAIALLVVATAGLLAVLGMTALGAGRSLGRSA